MGRKALVVLFLFVFIQIVLGKKKTTTSTTSTTPLAGKKKTTSTSTSTSSATPLAGKKTTAPAPAPTNYYPAATYNLVHDYEAGTSSFWSNWNYFTGPDPTDGFVNYESESGANSEGLTWNYDGASYFGANYWSDQPNGRDSVRLESKSTYNNVLIIAEFAWVPGSVCGSWPAFWTANLNTWPDGGEIDIMEGINNQNYDNHWAFHVGGTCSITGTTQSAEIDTYDCNAYAADQSSNAGCGGWATQDGTYGDEMNSYGGGVYAMDWRSTGIRIWEFPPWSIPSDISSGKPTTSGWGTPMVDLRSGECNIGNNFYDHQIVFDITFCGDWAGAEYNDWGCPGTCEDYVAYNASSFWESYWGVSSLRVYQPSTPL